MTDRIAEEGDPLSVSGIDLELQSPDHKFGADDLPGVDTPKAGAGVGPIRGFARADANTYSQLASPRFPSEPSTPSSSPVRADVALSPSRQRARSGSISSITTLNTSQTIPTSDGSGSRGLRGISVTLMNASLDTDFLAKMQDEEMKAIFDENYEIDEDADESDPLVAAMRYLKKRQDILKASSTDEAHVEQETRFGILLDEDEVSVLAEELRKQRAVQLWMYFDGGFGTLVLANATMDVLDQEMGFNNDPVVYLCSSAFVVCFIIEFAVRWYFSAGLRALLQDGWAVFDALIITISIVDIWVFELLKIDGSGGLAILRLTRMVRFIRLLRLLRQFKTIWFLVVGMLESVAILLWTVMLLLILCYIFSLLFVELLGHALKDEPEIQKYWGSIGASMLTLVQIATFDGSVGLIRNVVEAPHHMQWMISLFVVFIMIASLGCFNLMVGVLLTAAFDVTRMDTVVSDSCAKLLRHKGLTTLRTLLHKRCVTQIGCRPGSEFITRALINTWMQETEARDNDKTVGQLLAEANVTEEDVSAIFTEVGKIQQHEPHVTVDDFVQGCFYIQSEVHPLHMTYVVAGQHSMYDRLCCLEEYLTGLNTVIHHSSRQLRPALKKYYAPQSKMSNILWVNSMEKQEDEDDADLQFQKDMQFVKPSWETKQHSVNGKVQAFEAEMIHRQHRKAVESRVWGTFDGVFILVVCANGILIGYDVAKEASFVRDFIGKDLHSEDIMWMAQEVFFFATFCVEFFLRACLKYQMRVSGSCRTFLVVIPTIMLEMDRLVLSQVLGRLPGMLKNDRYMCFDAALLALGAIDNCFLRFFANGAGFLVLLRLFRGMRLLRIARILYLFHDLLALLGSVTQSIPIVFWGMVMLAGFTYIAAVFWSKMISSQLSGDVLAEWDSLTDIGFNLMRFATFSHWGKLAERMCDQAGSWAYAFVIMFTFYVGLGIMNLTTGVVVQKSFQVVWENNEDFTRRSLGELKVSAVSAVERMHRFYREEEIRKRSEYECSRYRTMRNFMNLWKIVHEHDSEIAEKVGRKSSAHHVSKAVDTIGLTKVVGLQKATSSDSIGLTSAEGSPPFDVVTSEIHLSKIEATRIGMSSSEDSEKTLHMMQVITETANEWMGDIKLAPQKMALGIMTTHQFWHIMGDTQFRKHFKSAGIRPDQLVMLFQKLDPINLGCITVDDFVEGLHRMQSPVQGVDVSSAKTAARSAHMSAQTMMVDATQLHDALMDCVAKLRGITLTGQETETAAEDGEPIPEAEDETADLMAAAQERVQSLQNRSLHLKIKKVEQHLKARRILAQSSGDVHVDMGEEGPEDDVSITSVKSGMD